MALARAQDATVTVQIDPWLRAKRDFTRDLSLEEATLFDAATPETILQDASDASRSHYKSSPARKVSQKLQPLIRALEGYGPALDVCANASSTILCPIWGSIRIVLILGRAFQKYFDDLLKILQSLGAALPRFKTYQALFPNDQHLINLLSDAYFQLVGFCMNVKSLFCSKRTSLGKFSPCLFLCRAALRQVPCA